VHRLPEVPLSEKSEPAAGSTSSSAPGAASESSGGGGGVPVSSGGEGGNEGSTAAGAAATSSGGGKEERGWGWLAGVGAMTCTGLVVLQGQLIPARGCVLSVKCVCVLFLNACVFCRSVCQSVCVCYIGSVLWAFFGYEVG